MGRYSLAQFWENFKKVKIEITGPKNITIFKFSVKTENDVFWSCDFILNFLPLFPKMRQSILTIPVIFFF